jgi:hypothetical protein
LHLHDRLLAGCEYMICESRRGDAVAERPSLLNGQLFPV